MEHLDLTARRVALGIDHVQRGAVGQHHERRGRHHRDAVEHAHRDARVDELAGPQALVGVGEHGLGAHGADLRIDRVVDEVERAEQRLAPARDQRLDLGARARRGQQVLQVAFGHGEAHGDGVELGDGDQRQRGLHQRTRVDVDGADAPRDGRAQRGVAQRHLRRLHGRAVGRHGGALRLELRQRGVGRALGNEVLCHQVLAALVLALQVGHGGLVLLLLGPGAGQVGLVVAVVQREEQLPRFHELAFLDVHRAHGVGDLRAQVDAVERNHAAVDLHRHRHVLLLGRGQRDQRGGRPGVRGLGVFRGRPIARHAPPAACDGYDQHAREGEGGRFLHGFLCTLG
ncbi:hypothetical protein D3C72_1321500 [compost metagenome]